MCTRIKEPRKNDVSIIQSKNINNLEHEVRYASGSKDRYAILSVRNDIVIKCIRVVHERNTFRHDAFWSSLSRRYSPKLFIS